MPAAVGVGMLSGSPPPATAPAMRQVATPSGQRIVGEGELALEPVEHRRQTVHRPRAGGGLEGFAQRLHPARSDRPAEPLQRVGGEPAPARSAPPAHAWRSALQHLGGAAAERFDQPADHLAGFLAEKLPRLVERRGVENRQRVEVRIAPLGGRRPSGRPAPPLPPLPPLSGAVRVRAASGSPPP